MRFRRGRRERDEYRAGLSTPDRWLVDSLAGPPTPSGERVTTEKALGLTGVFAAGYKLAELVGQLPLKVYRVVDPDSRVEADTHRAWRLLHDAPNPYTIAHTFWAAVTVQLALGGNSYLLKQRDSTGIVESLWLLDPSRMEVEVNAANQRRYVYTNGIERQPIPEEDLTHIIGFSLDGIMGCSRIWYCRNRFGAALARDIYEGSFYSQGARVPGVIEYPGRLGPDGTKNLAESFQTKHGGARRQHKVPVLEEGASFKATGMSLADMQFVENAQLSLTEIAVLFDLPPGELGGMHGGPLEYSTEELNQIRLTRAVIPYTNRIAKTLSNDPAILPQNVMYAEFVLEALMRPDAKTRVEYWKTLLDMGVVDQAYIASRENLPPPPKPKPAPTPPPPPPGNGASTVNLSGLNAMIGGQ